MRARRGVPAAAWFAGQSFHTFLTAPSTGPRLDAMLADNARVDAVVDVAIVPVPDAPRGPVVDVQLVRRVTPAVTPV